MDIKTSILLTVGLMFYTRSYSIADTRCSEYQPENSWSFDPCIQNSSCLQMISFGEIRLSFSTESIRDFGKCSCSFEFSKANTTSVLLSVPSLTATFSSGVLGVEVKNCSQCCSIHDVEHGDQFEFREIEILEVVVTSSEITAQSENGEIRITASDTANIYLRCGHEVKKMHKPCINTNTARYDGGISLTASVAMPAALGTLVMLLLAIVLVCGIVRYRKWVRSKHNSTQVIKDRQNSSHSEKNKEIAEDEYASISDDNVLLNISSTLHSNPLPSQNDKLGSKSKEFIPCDAPVYAVSSKVLQKEGDKAITLEKGSVLANQITGTGLSENTLTEDSMQTYFTKTEQSCVYNGHHEENFCDNDYAEDIKHSIYMEENIVYSGYNDNIYNNEECVEDNSGNIQMVENCVYGGGEENARSN